MRKWIPSFLKPLIRFIYYPQERRKVFKQIRIRKIQDANLQQFDSQSKKLILFLIAGAEYETGSDKISGGIISIVSLCEESAKLKAVHQAEVLLCTFPGEYALAKHTQFKNETNVFRYEQMEKYFASVEEIMVHIPEYICTLFLNFITKGKFNWLKRVGRLHVNVLNQNIRLMPTVEQVAELTEVANKVTITTAHQQYCTQAFRKTYNVVLHKFSVWISPEKYYFKPYSEKEELMIVSPDWHPEKEAILSKLVSETRIRTQIIQNLTYEQYKEVISRAKWSLTFGEGLDGYFIEPVFSGAISFAVYNQDFFTSDFESQETIYKSMDLLKNSIISDMQRLKEREAFEAYQQKQHVICALHYSAQSYRENIEKFYKGEYTFK